MLAAVVRLELLVCSPAVAEHLLVQTYAAAVHKLELAVADLLEFTFKYYEKIRNTCF
jgi:hypothetical protein